MTAAEAIAEARRAFRGDDVAITAEAGTLRVVSRTHETGCGFMYESAYPGHDEQLANEMLPQARKAMRKAILSGKAPKRAA